MVGGLGAGVLEGWKVGWLHGCMVRVGRLEGLVVGGLKGWKTGISLGKIRGCSWGSRV